MEIDKLEITQPADPRNVSFWDNDKEVGKLDWSSGTLKFSGSADKSAKVFFGYLTAHFTGWLNGERE